jgi:hypothetical protein
MRKTNLVRAVGRGDLLLGTIACLATAVTCGGCTVLQRGEGDATKPVSLEWAFANLESDMSRVGVLVPADLLLPNALDRQQAADNISEFIRKAQCFDIDPATHKPDPTRRTRNPLIPVTTGPVQLQVQGQLATGGGFSVSATPSITGTITRQGQQQIMVPVTMVSLTNLGSFYMGQQLTFIQYATVANGFFVKVPPAGDPNRANEEYNQIAAYVSNILSVSAKLDSIASSAITAYDADVQYQLSNHGQTIYCLNRDRGNGAAGGYGWVQPTAPGP